MLNNKILIYASKLHLYVHFARFVFLCYLLWDGVEAYMWAKEERKIAGETMVSGLDMVQSKGMPHHPAQISEFYTSLLQFNLVGLKIK